MFAINRYTAICSPAFHMKIWKGKMLYIILAFIVLFPFIVNGYVLLEPHCSMFYKEVGCEDYLVMSLHMSSIINVVLTIVALCLIITGVCSSRNKIRSQTLARVNYKMIVYTAISTILFIPRHVCVLFTVLIPSQCDFFYDLAMWFFFSQHYLPILLLPMMNIIYRSAFKRFIRKRICCRNKIVIVVM
uniref:Serpentine receptor class gamma n=1 Tax=Panagrellus redivivus TaxID=6233 RepID=A0A7E4VVY1_PANRE